MKRLDDHTKEDLLELTEDQTYTLIESECAHNGAPIASTLPVRVEPCEAKPDVRGYRVKTDDLIFATLDEAEEVVQFLTGLKRMKQASLKGEYAWQGPYQLAPQDKEVTVETEHFWTPAHFALHKRDIERHKQEVDSYNAEVKDHQNGLDNRNSIEDEVWGKVREAQDEARDQEKLRSQFKEYCKIAGGNQQTALNFLLKATPHEESFVRTTLNMQILIGDSDYDEERDGVAEEG